MPTHQFSRRVLSQSGLLLCALCVSAVSAVRAGPLTPPAGPVAPTPGPEPRIPINSTNTPGGAGSVFRITQPGSYYLTGNVIGEAGKHGIDIASSGVTVDLNGFEVIGNGSASGAFDGVRSAASIKNITVRNGHVRNWGDDGVEIASIVNATGACVEHVQATGNGGAGISCGTDNGRVIDCSASENGLFGISARLISRCSSVDNVMDGLATGQGGTILDSVSFSNGGDGVSTGFGATVVNCTSDNNTGDGIEASNGTTITHCSFFANGGSGINVFSSITIRNCTSVSNLSYGIDTDNACHIEGCTANTNALGGIRTGSRGVVRNNLASSNATGAEIGSGIEGVGSDTRFEGNTCNNNDFGIDIDGTGNIIINNTCANNTQAFVIGPDNFYGPIIDRRIPTTVPSTPAAVGFAAASTMGSTDPRANFAQ